MTKRGDFGLNAMFCTKWFSLLKRLKSGPPSAKVTKRADLGLKMTKGADLGLKRLFCRNSCTLLKMATK